MADRGTTMKTGMRFIAKSQQASKATKTPKAPSRVFGSSSQFSGVGNGVPGDPRK